MKIKTIILAMGLAAVSTQAMASGDTYQNYAKVEHGVGEYENEFETSRSMIEVKQHFGENAIYGKIRAENGDHEVEYADGSDIYFGLGVEKNGLGFEGMMNSDEFRFYGYYTEDGIWADNITGMPLAVEGGIFYSDYFDYNRSRSGIRVQAGADVGSKFGQDDFFVGGFYEAGDMMKSSINDIYGIYLQKTW